MFILRIFSQVKRRVKIYFDFYKILALTAFGVKDFDVPEHLHPFLEKLNKDRKETVNSSEYQEKH